MAWLMLDRRIVVPPAYLARSCLLVQYRLPGLRHCYVLCHHPQCDTGRATDDILPFFIEEAQRLASNAVGDAQAFMLIYSGSAMRRRANLHVHVFVVQKRWQKAWVYLILGVKNSGLAIYRCWPWS